MIYLQLFLKFFMTGLFAVGGGMATIPFLYEMSDKTGWFTHGELANMIAVGESTPGPIGVNMATYVGFLTGNGADGVAGGVFGAVIATLGLITPSVLIILIIAAILNQFRLMFLDITQLCQWKCFVSKRPTNLTIKFCVIQIRQ